MSKLDGEGRAFHPYDLMAIFFHPQSIKQREDSTIHLILYFSFSTPFIWFVMTFLKHLPNF